MEEDNNVIHSDIYEDSSDSSDGEPHGLPVSILRKSRKFKVSNGTDEVIGIAVAADRSVSMGEAEFSIDVEGLPIGVSFATSKKANFLVAGKPIFQADAHSTTTVRYKNDSFRTQLATLWVITTNGKWYSKEVSAGDTVIVKKNFTFTLARKKLVIPKGTDGNPISWLHRNFPTGKYDEMMEKAELEKLWIPRDTIGNPSLHPHIQRELVTSNALLAMEIKD